MPRVRQEKTRASNTMTESAFWGMIRSALRRRSMYWRPVQDVKKAARRDYKGENKRRLYEYQCAVCNGWFPDKEIQVDHIVPAGSLTNAEDLKGFVERLFCESDGLRVLCKPCHHNITHGDQEACKD